jgi:hypothetical protein
MKNKVILALLITLCLATVWIISGSENLLNNRITEKETNVKEDKGSPLRTENHIIINEIIAQNSSLHPDSKGNYVDLIEIYNPTDEVIHLKGYGLSDDPSVPHKWVFEELILQPYSFLLIYACPPDELEIPLGASELEVTKFYTNFKLKASGERLALSNPDGKIIDILSYERLDYDMSYGRADDNTLVYFLIGSPGSVNSGDYSANINDYYERVLIEPSHPTGIYTQSFDLSFEIDESFQLRYTVDGNDPTPDSTLYEGPIRVKEGSENPLRYAGINSTFYGPVQVSKADVNRGTVIKARYFNNRIPVGDMYIGTYFVWEEGSQRYSMDIVSLTTDSDNLFNPDTGIYVVGNKFKREAPSNPDGGTPANYNQRGREWEREGHIEFFDSKGVSVYQQHIGIRNFGGWSRANAKKSFRLIARKEYDVKEQFDYPFFDNLVDHENEKIEEFQTILLRSGANDWEYTLFRDVLTDELVRGMLDFQEYKPVIVFLNGEYWGIYNLREHMDEKYIASHYDIKEEELVMFAYNPEEIEVYVGDEEDLAEYKQFLATIDQMDMTLEENFNFVSEKIDFENFIDYYITQIYVNNADWPGNNSKLWKYTGDDASPGQGVKDGKFRFLLYDTEFNFGLYEGPGAARKNTFELLRDESSTTWPNPSWSTIMFRKFMENSQFRELFFTRMADLLNSRFEKNQVFRTIKTLTEVYKPEMGEYIDRWKFWAMKNETEWEDKQVSSLYEFATRRGEYLFSYAIKDYQLKGAKKIHIQHQSEIEIQVNDAYIVDFTDAQGKQLEEKSLMVFSDYPIIIEAITSKSKPFLGWEITSQEGEWTDYILEGDLNSARIKLLPTTNITLKPKR